MVAVSGQGVEREEQCDKDDAANEHVEENCEGAGLNGAVEARALGQRELPEAGPEREGCSEGSDPAEGAADHGRGQRGVDQHDEDAGASEDQLGDDAVDVENGVHRCTSLLSSRFTMSCWAKAAGRA